MMSVQRNKKNSFLSKCGFTLIDFLMYMAIVGIVLTAAGAVGLNVLYGKAKLGSVEEIGVSSRYVLQKITERIRNSESIVFPLAGTASTTLILSMPDSAQNPTTFSFVSGTIVFSEGSNPPLPLLPNGVVVDTLDFLNVTGFGSTGVVRIELSLKTNNPQNRNEYAFNENFYASANVRK